MQPMGAKQRGWPTSTSPRSPPIAPQPTDELPAVLFMAIGGLISNEDFGVWICVCH